jgi:hypothetical protein
MILILKVIAILILTVIVSKFDSNSVKKVLKKYEIFSSVCFFSLIFKYYTFLYNMFSAIFEKFIFSYYHTCWIVCQQWYYINIFLLLHSNQTLLVQIYKFFGQTIFMVFFHWIRNFYGLSNFFLILRLFHVLFSN